MKELNFRALTKENNVMVFGDLINTPGDTHRIIWFELKGELPLDVDYKSFNELVQSSTIGRNSNIKDKNGKYIFSGDIISFGENYPLEEVVYQNGCFWRKEKNYFVGLYEDEGNVFLEVVGNIYQNPELLTV